MTVDRILPTDEARDLLELTTELADRELAPKVVEHEQRAEFPREVLRTLAGRVCSACRTRRSTAAPPSRTRSIFRCWRSWPAAGSRSPRR